jgi:hypothetical protein
MDHAPDTLTTGEWKALVVLAQDANEKTRITYRPVNDPVILRRVRLAPNAWANVRASLVRKGALEVVEQAKRGRSAKYRIPVFAERMGHPTGDPFEEAEHPISHPTGDPTEEMPHLLGEANGQWVTQQVIPTPLSSSGGSSSTSEPSAPPAPAGGGGGYAEDDIKRAAKFLEDLPAPWGSGKATAARLAPLLLENAKAQGWDIDTELARELTADRGPVANPAGALRFRITDLRKRPTQQRASPPGLPDACQPCLAQNPAAAFNPRFRRRDGQPCPDCHPDHVEDPAA